MKNILLACLLAVSSLASAQVTPITPNSPEWKETFEPPFTTPTDLPRSALRTQLFDMLRPSIERQTPARPLQFQGELKAFKNWAFFGGSAVDKSGKRITFEPSGNTEMAALWLRTREGWKLVDYAVGFGDPFYWVWVEQYGAPRQLLGAP